MKKITLNRFWGLLFGISLLTNCNTPADKVENAQNKVENAQNEVNDANEDLRKANEEYLADIENYRQTTAEKIAANDERIAEIRTDLKHEKKADRAERRKRLDDLEDQNRTLKKRLREYKAEGKEKWENFKGEFNHDMEGLGNALKDFTHKNTSK